MERARVAIFEDEDDIRMLLKIMIERAGHQVVAQAATAEAAIATIEELPPDAVEAAIIDRNYKHSQQTGDHVAAAWHAKFPGSISIGFTSEETGVLGTTYQVTKNKEPLQRVGEIISEHEPPHPVSR